jgi:fatty acid desaturase
MRSVSLEASQAPSSSEIGVRTTTARDRRGSILRYKADRGPITFVVGIFIARLAIWALATPLVCAFSVVPLAFLGVFIAPINHHHQHVNSFRAGWLNRFYDLALALQSGIGPYAWVLHHNLGHHLNYLNQPPHESPDESHWMRGDGTQMGRLEYTIHLFFHHQIDIIRVGLRHRRIFRYFLLMKLPLWGLIGVGLWINPLATVLVFLLPAFATLLHTAWATYEHHSGLPRDGHIDASRNRVNPLYNALTGNLGLHTAHHQRPGLHWSLLPELHAKIEGEIPEELLLKSFW